MLRHVRIKRSTSHGFSIESRGGLDDNSLKSDAVFGKYRGFLGRILLLLGVERMNEYVECLARPARLCRI